MNEIFETLPPEVNQGYEDFLRDLETYDPTHAVVTTHSGYPLSTKEAKFISILLATGSVPKALQESGCSKRDALEKDYIIDEVKYRLSILKDKTIADAREVMQFFTAVMRGEIKDQFGLDAPLAERTAAAKELAKRTVDVENKLKAQSDATVTIHLVWD